MVDRLPEVLPLRRRVLKTRAELRLASTEFSPKLITIPGGPRPGILPSINNLAITLLQMSNRMEAVQMAAVQMMQGASGLAQVCWGRAILMLLPPARCMSTWFK